MTEYIEREAAYDIFSAKQQELLKFYRYYQLNDEEKEEFNRYESYLKEIEAIPTADVVEVVRCKDCMWWYPREYDSVIGRCENPYNGLANEYIEYDDFCSYGKKKEGAEE